MAADSIELVSKAPKVYIETVLVVRPIKVIATILGVLAAIFILVSTAASAWLISRGAREGIWERCVFRSQAANQTRLMDCGHELLTDWVKAPQTLSIISLLVCVGAVVATSVALRTFNLKLKYRLYWVALIGFFIAVGFELISLVAFPIKFLQEISDKERQGTDWSFGWAYIIGWAGAICEFTSGLFLLLDRGADEAIFRENVDEGIEDV